MEKKTIHRLIMNTKPRIAKFEREGWKVSRDRDPELAEDLVMVEKRVEVSPK